MQGYHDIAMEQHLITVPLKRRQSHVRCFVKFSKGHTRLYKGISWTLSSSMSPLLQTVQGRTAFFPPVSYKKVHLMAHQDTSRPPVSKDCLCWRAMLEQLFSNKNGNELQEGGHKRTKAEDRTSWDWCPLTSSSWRISARAGVGRGQHLIRCLHQLWSCSGHPNRQEGKNPPFLKAFFFLLYNDGMQ